MRFVLTVLIFMTGELTYAQTASSPNKTIFEQQIEPVLRANCAGCHSATNASSGLTLATLETALVGGKQGPAIVPGDSKNSLLIQFVRGERTPKMPMGGALGEEKIAALVKAIDAMQGSPNSTKKKDPHLEWLLHKPVAPAVPSVVNAGWTSDCPVNDIGVPISAPVVASIKTMFVAAMPS